jgi:hypothetical protein
MFISGTTADGAGIGGYITTWDDSTNSVKGHLIIQSNTNSDSTYCIFSITGTITDASPNYGVTLSNPVGSLPSNTELCVITFVRAGDVGATGAGGSGGGITNPGDNRLLTSDGTAGGIVAESGLTYNGSQLNITGNVGIGTTNPRTLLDVTSSSGDAAATIQTSSESQDSILYLGIGSWSRANLHFCLNNNSASNDYPATNATLSDSRMIIQPSGNVGIGTTVPNNILDVAGTISNRGGTTNTTAGFCRLVQGDATNTGILEFNQATASASPTRRGYIGLANSSRMVIYGESGIGLAFFAGASQGMTLDTSGRLGIGATSPLQLLDVRGNALLNAGDLTTNTRLILGPAPSTTNLDYCSLIQSTPNTGANFGSTLSFWTHGVATTAGDPTQRMTIDNAGDVGIGTTAPRALLDVYGPAYIRLPVSVTSGTSLSLNITEGSRNDGTYYFITSPGFNSVTTVGFTASVNGGSFWTLYNSTGSYLSITVTGGHILIPNLNPFPIPPYSSATITAHPTVGNSYLIM